MSSDIFTIDNLVIIPNNQGMTLQEKLISKIEKYASDNGLKPSTVGLKIFGDGKRYDRIKNGGGITLRSIEKAENWFTSNKSEKK